VESYQVDLAVWVMVVRPQRCPHCGGEHTYVLWGSYLRWVYTSTDRIRVRIQRVRCRLCGVTDALLPSFLHMFRRYSLTLIQQAIFLTLDGGLWGKALVDVVGPYYQPAPATIHEWVWSFALSAAWLLTWLQQSLTTLDPLATLDPGRPPTHLLDIPHHRRGHAFLQAWQTLRLAETLYAAVRTRQPNLAFQADVLLAFLAAALGAAGRIPRLLWPQAQARAP
jgi:hypothetical protein